MILDEFVRGCPSFRICREMWRGTRAPEDLRLSSDAWVLDGEFGRSREDEQGMSFDKGRRGDRGGRGRDKRSEEHTSELQSLMRISYAVFCLKTKNTSTTSNDTTTFQHTY